MKFNSNQLIILQLVIIVLAIVVIYVLMRVDKTRTLTKRINRYSIKEPKNNFKNKFYPLNLTYYGLIKAVSLITCKSPLTIKFCDRYYDKYLEYKNKYIKPIDVMSMKVVFAFFNLFIVTLIFIFQNADIRLYDIILSLFVGFFIPDCYYVFKHSLTKREIGNNLITVVLILKNGLNKNKSFEECVSCVIEEMDGATKDEFNKVLKDLKEGIDFKEALENLNMRINNFETKILVKYINMATYDYHSMIASLEKVEKNILFKDMVDSELNSMLNRYRAIALVLASLPPLAVFLLNIIYEGKYFTNILNHYFGRYYLTSLCLIYLLYLILIRIIFRTRPYYEDK